MAKRYTEEIIKDAVDTTTSMRAAAKLLGCKIDTLRNYAEPLGLYITNQSGKGTKKIRLEGNGKYHLDDILNGHHPHYGSNHLKKRLYDVGLKENKCECCGIVDWMDKPISLELDHIDGNPRNHILDNLRILCLNCHSQTPTFRNKSRVLH